MDCKDDYVADVDNGRWHDYVLFPLQHGWVWIIRSRGWLAYIEITLLCETLGNITGWLHSSGATGNTYTWARVRTSLRSEVDETIARWATRVRGTYPSCRCYGAPSSFFPFQFPCCSLYHIVLYLGLGQVVGFCLF